MLCLNGICVNPVIVVYTFGSYFSYQNNWRTEDGNQPNIDQPLPIQDHGIQSIEAASNKHNHIYLHI